MDGATEALVRMAWARIFRLADDALSGPPGRIGVVSATAVMTVRLWDHEVVCAPVPVLPGALELAERGRLTVDGMIALAGPRGRLLGQADLAYAGRRVEQDPTLLLTCDVAAARDLERQCRPEEVAEADLSTMDHLFVALDRERRPVAGAGYQVQAEILAHLSVLTGPAYRRRGLARGVAAAAFGHAVDRELIGQWRSRVGHHGSAGLAARLGFETVGRQVTVLVDPDGLPATISG